MKIVYLFNRPTSEADELEPDRVYADYPGTERMERISMIDSGGLRAGDELILRAAGDLGKGAEAAALRGKIEAMGVVVTIAPANRAPRKPGRAKRLNLTPEQEKHMCAIWTSPAEQAHALKRMSEIAGQPVNRNQANRLCGPRFKY